MQDTLSALRVAFGKGQIHLAKSLHLFLAHHAHYIYFFHHAHKNSLCFTQNTFSKNCTLVIITNYFLYQNKKSLQVSTVKLHLNAVDNTF